MPPRPEFAGFFRRDDERDDAAFYASPRFVHHLDEGARAAVGQLYRQRGLHQGRVLDLMGSWVSHFLDAPQELTVLGMNAAELAANPQATATVVHDLNRDPTLPFASGSFDAVTCCASVDYLVAPVAVLAEVARVLTPGGQVAITFSNRCFPTKAVRGWLATAEDAHAELVAGWLGEAGLTHVAASRCPTSGHDPLWAVCAERP